MASEAAHDKDRRRRPLPSIPQQPSPVCLAIFTSFSWCTQCCRASSLERCTKKNSRRETSHTFLVRSKKRTRCDCSKRRIYSLRVPRALLSSLLGLLPRHSTLTERFPFFGGPFRQNSLPVLFIVGKLDFEALVEPFHSFINHVKHGGH